MKATTVKDYLDALPEERKAPVLALRDTILTHLPTGFEETITYGMIGYVVPHTLYPAGYHTDPAQPLPFISIASQKNFIALYHMGLYADEQLLQWFQSSYASHVSTKLDMGKSCIRFKKPSDIPLLLIGELCSKISVQQWITRYEKSLKRT